MSQPDSEQHRVHISQGPRWSQLVDALDQAEEHLAPPLDEAEIARGWTEDFRGYILASVKEIRGDLRREPAVQQGHYKSWVRDAPLDPRVEDQRWAYALRPDNAVVSIRDAEDLLASSVSLAEDLPDLVATQEFGSIDPIIARKIMQAINDIAETLRSGDFVTLGQFEAWDECLRACGVQRRILKSARLREAQRRADGGSNFDFIEERPPGVAWDRIELYDSLLVDVMGREIRMGGRN